MENNKDWLTQKKAEVVRFEMWTKAVARLVLAMLGYYHTEIEGSRGKGYFCAVKGEFKDIPPARTKDGKCLCENKTLKGLILDVLDLEALI